MENQDKTIQKSHNMVLVTTCDQISMISIENLIHVIRGKQVMLDNDLARLYGVETKALNQAVKRNVERFPEDFMFQLTKEECLRSQIVTLNEARGKHLKYYPHVFTENGVAMISSVLRSKTAIEVNIKIMRAFTAMRGFLMNNASIFHRIERLEIKQLKTDEKVDAILDRLNSNSDVKEGVFFHNQIFDAYTFVCKLIRSASKRIILIDNYVDETVLTLLDKRNDTVSAKIVTEKISNQFKLDLEKHNKQYPPIQILKSKNIHDRFLIIDDSVYHIGASIKDLGKKLFAFSKLELMSADNLIRHIMN